MSDPFSPRDEILDLSGQTPVASGALQHVYAWPGRPDLLVKVVRANFAQETWTGWRGALKRRRRVGVFGSALRAVTEQLVLRNAGLELRRHLQEIVGFAETSEGTGLVVRALRGRDGGYAPTLRRVLDEGRWSPALQAELDAFLDWMIASPLAVGDLHAGNLVLAWDAAHGERLVMIDGMGDKGLLPLNSLFPVLNRRHKRRRAERLRAAVGRIAARAAKAPA